MFQHILLPLDLSEDHRRTVNVGADLAHRHRARLTLLHVIEEIAGAASDDAELGGFYSRLEERARERMATEEERLATKRDLVVDAAIVVGKRAEQIIGFAADQGVDLIVMSSRRLARDQAPVTWPTISHQVALVAPVSTLLVR
ncbi:MAG: universal stress protein [Acidobacteriota bacterium]